MFGSSKTLLSLALLWHYVVSLQVTPGSSCATLCLENPESDALDAASSSTKASDISCSDDDYANSSKGVIFKNCTECLQDSRAVSGEENDLSWYLYNIRYSVDVCVYGYPNVSKAVSSPCDIDYACQPLKKALEADSLDPAVATEFDYCEADGGKFSGSQIDACIQCFENSSNQAFMASFFTALKAGCQQRPQAGALLGLSGSLFTNYTVKITAPPINETVSSADTSGSTAMTTGAIVGIAVGAALLFLGGTGLFWVYYRKQKRMYADLDSIYDPRGGCKLISPPLQGGFSSMRAEIGPGSELQQLRILSDYELKTQQGYPKNANYYDQLEKEIQNRRTHYAFDPNKPGSSPSGALPAHHAHINLPRNLSRDSNRSREPSPSPPPPVKSNNPDSYALQAYLNAAEGANKIMPGPPPGPPPAIHPRGPSPAPSRDSSSLPRPPHGRPSSIAFQQCNSTQTSSTMSPSLSPPPRVPSIQLPSVPRIRIPKKYLPPKIQIRGVPPVADKGAGNNTLPIGLEISNPIVSHEHRFSEDPYLNRGKTSLTGDGNIVEQHAEQRIRRPYEEVQINTGKSSLFG